MRSPSFKQQIAKPVALGPEHNPWYWNPYRPGVLFAPPSFTKRFKEEMGEELEITWNPIQERWQLWSRSPRMQNPICSGWRLIFIHNGPKGEYLPLDERVYARLYSCSAQVHGSARAYFDRICNEMERDREKRDRQSTQDAIDMAMPQFEYSKIKNIGNGSKFADYLA